MLLVCALTAGAAAQAEAPDASRPAPAAAAKPAQPSKPRAAAKANAKAKKAPAKKAPPVEPAPAPAAAPDEAPVDPYAAPPAPSDQPALVIPPRLSIADATAMQGLFAVQRLDGWLLADRGDGANPVAVQLTLPAYKPAGPWYYLLPASGEPVLLCQPADAAAFDKLAGRKLTFQSDRELTAQLKAVLKGKKTLAMELAAAPASTGAAAAGEGKAGKAGKAPKAPPAPKDPVRDALKALKITAVSSDQLVQYTTAVWGQAGHTSHHVAVHHLIELRKDALAFVAKQLRAGAAVTERDVAARIERGMQMRGVVGPAPRVAAGAHTADPSYTPAAEGSAPIQRGDVLSIALAVRLDRPDGIFAAQTWVAFAGEQVPERVVKLFDSVTLARDQAIALIADRARKRRPLRGAEVDALVRGTLGKAGLGAQILHPAGHSIGPGGPGGPGASGGAAVGTGANLDDKDSRSLVPGTGVTVGPGVYFAGELGVRSEVTLFLSPSGPEITTPAQVEVEALLAP